MNTKIMEEKQARDFCFSRQLKEEMNWNDYTKVAPYRIGKTLVFAENYSNVIKSATEICSKITDVPKEDKQLMRFFNDYGETIGLARISENVLECLKWLDSEVDLGIQWELVEDSTDIPEF